MNVRWQDYTLILGLAFVLCLAYVWPELARTGGCLGSSWTPRVAIFCVFLLQGWLLPTRVLLHGLLRWREQGFVLLWNFVFYPLLALVFFRTGWIPLSDDLVRGFLYLSLLASTVASAILFTGSAEGDVSLAVPATALSNVAAVFWVPTMAVFFLSSGGGSSLVSALSRQVSILSAMIILPLLLGQGIRALLGEMSARGRRRSIWVNYAVIIFMVTRSFSDSFIQRSWEGYGWIDLLWVVFGVLLLLGTGGVLIWFSSAWVTSCMNARIALYFTASQKGLSAGVPMAAALYAGDPALGAILLPLLLFHPLQLLLAAVLVSWMKRAKRSSESQ